MTAGLSVLDAATKDTTFAYELIDEPFGGDGIDRAGDPLPQSTIDVSKQADAVLLSACLLYTSNVLFNESGY